jgi:ABC-2 type transport system ATP-binding protein
MELSNGAVGTQAVAELRGVHKRYGRIEALRGIDLQVRPGELVALLGPNGAGKTTTIRLLLDLIRPTSRRVTVLGSTPGDPASPCAAGSGTSPASSSSMAARPAKSC